MKPSTIHVVSALVGEYSLLIPANCILEIAIADKDQLSQIQKHHNLGTIYWKQCNIPLLIINSNNTDVVSHFIIIRSLFNSNYNYYALACYAVPKIIEIYKNDIKNTIAEVNNCNLKYQILIKDTTFFIADFKNIESMLKKSYN